MTNTDHQNNERVNLLFFSRIIASITHELKNDMAVLNEETCLIKEILALKNIGESQLNDVTETINKIINRIGQTSSTLDRLGMFAHTADAEKKSVDLCQIVSLVVRLAERFAALKSVKLEFTRPDFSLNIKTDPLSLEKFIFTCIMAAVDDSNGKSSINISMKKAGKKINIMLQGDFVISKSIKSEECNIDDFKVNLVTNKNSFLIELQPLI